MSTKLIHLSNQVVDEVCSFTCVSTFNEVLELTCSPSSQWVGELERPQEVVALFERWSDVDYLMHQIFDRDDSVFTEMSFDDGVV